MLHFGVITLFPQMFAALAAGGIVERALKRGVVGLRTFNPRDFTMDRHRNVDDRPYGGGPGMVLMAQPLEDAVRAARGELPGGTRTVVLSPQGEPLTQARLRQLSTCDGLLLVCGRYEGFDERFVQDCADEQISIGDYVLSGGELAAMVVVDGVTRLLPGALGHVDSAREDSFSDGLLDCPHYTRPVELAGRTVPEVLLSGDHGAIRRWRLKQSLGRTWERRPDLLAKRQLDAESRLLLDEYIREREPACHEADPAAGSDTR
ncbi:MAG: tRNA (guanosine(37)-N1)-methyltransferase TrmD [Gammaproteobacteria bacterium]|nr:tRNA (guanosine(37)-N1)-methyltransferase TrmD [Gammaproteobacteria bacterium]